MAIQNFVDGALYGKIGQFVGAEWRGIDYMRSYAKPKQPNTPAQILHKQNFKRLITIANNLNSIWFPYVFAPIKGKTLSNQFMTLNKGIYATDGMSFIPLFPYDAETPDYSLTNYTQTDTGFQTTLQYNLTADQGNFERLIYWAYCPHLYQFAFKTSTQNNVTLNIVFPESWKSLQIIAGHQCISSTYIFKPREVIIPSWNS